MILIILLFGLFFISIVPVFFQSRHNFWIMLTKTIMIGLIIFSIGYVFNQHYYGQYTVKVLDFENILLKLSIQYDGLAKIMLVFILIIGFFIYRYAQNYLESDNTRIRFLSQFNLVLLSVALLSMASNLLTAFVAWQFIGINLYLLLNHYHSDPAANRAAKKKFVINRIGDSSFLLAIVLAYHTENSVSFAAIQHSEYAGFICTLIFISVMTKCAQFPFHIWLIDTMETPTPVSALMHAGVINAGGILLARISSTFIEFHSLLYLVVLVGLTSVVLSIHWMNQQADIKKKLAYSTMGQMGYMLAQCGLGAFPAAIFHLMSHGFYKASLFLNTGETLNAKGDDGFEKNSFKNLILSVLIGLIIFFICIFSFKNLTAHIPIIMYGFILMTIITLVLKVNLIANAHSLVKVAYYLIIALILSAYIFIFHEFSQLLVTYEYDSQIPQIIQYVLLMILFGLQFLMWLKVSFYSQDKFKDHAEFLLRRLLLHPLRSAGDIINIASYRKYLSIIYILSLFFVVMFFLYGLIFNGCAEISNKIICTCLISIFLTIGLGALIIANRCLSIKSLIIYLVLFELAFTNIAFYHGSGDILKIGIYHIINISGVLVMLALLAKRRKTNEMLTKDTNRLPTRAFYLVFGLLLLIGIPGTASFISEFYLLSALLNQNLVFILMYIGLIILIAIVVMHSLQLYVFNKNYAVLFSEPISKKNHIIFLIIIVFNILCGIYPNIILHYI